MIQEFKKVWKQYTIGMLWLLGLLWPMLGIHADGTLTFQKTITIWSYILAGSFVCFMIYIMKSGSSFKFIADPVSRAANGVKSASAALPIWVWITVAVVLALIYPQLAGRYGTDVAITVLFYICLGLGLNVVVGLAGMLDLGYIAFYGVGAYTYAILNVTYGLAF